MPGKWVLVLLAAFPVFSARAQMAQIVLGGSASTSGTSDFFSVFGAGFSMSGGGAFEAAEPPCAPDGYPTCVAPGSYFFTDGINSEQIGGMAGGYTVDGETYSYFCNSGTVCSGGIDFSGEFTLPDFGYITAQDVHDNRSLWQRGGH